MNTLQPYKKIHNRILRFKYLKIKNTSNTFIIDVGESKIN